LIEFIARMFTSPYPPQTKAKADSFIRDWGGARSACVGGNLPAKMTAGCVATTRRPGQRAGVTAIG
jgi:hypothetical protein